MTHERLIAGGGVALLMLSSVALADTIQVTPRNGELARAFERAQAGDRVVLRKGKYAGGVFQVPHGLQIVSRGATVMGDLQLNGDDLSVRGLRLGEEAHLVVVGNGATLTRMRAAARDPSRPAIQVVGNDACISRGRFGPNETSFGWAVELIGSRAIVERSRFKNGSRMVTIQGVDAIVERNVLRRTSSAIEVTGDSFQIEDNRIAVGVLGGKDVGGIPSCPGITIYDDSQNGTIANNVVNHPFGGAGFMVQASNTTITNNVDRGSDLTEASFNVVGSGNSVTQNSIREYGDVGISVRGDDNFIGGNTLRYGEGSALSVRGDHNVVDTNQVTAVGGHGVIVRGDCSEVCGNTVNNPFDMGVLVIGDGNTVERNTVEAAFSDAICVDGDDNDVSQNQVPASYGDGIVIYGSSNTLTKNEVSDTRRGGICIASGEDNSVVHCKAIDCIGLGLENLGQMTDLIDSTFLGNATDIRNVGSFDKFTRIRFETGLK